jgi:putative membrane-bound dehydrogenase-like protein
VLYTGFNPGNPQHRINGPTWGLDNWIYLANGDSGGTPRSLKTGQTAEISGRDLRVRIQTGHADDGRLDPQSGMTQFGRARDDWGDWFGCNNPNPIWQFALADQYIRRNPHVIAPESRRPLGRDMTIDRVYPISRTLARFNDLHTANRFTSCCGLQMYRDTLFGPDFADCWFVCEPVHNLVHRGHMAADACGFIARRDDDEQQSEFLSSTDGWFRPTMVRVGLDGALWITDMYRAVIEHPQWIPDDWEKRLDLRAGSQQGRIYRIAPVGAPRRPIPRFDQLDVAGLVAALDSDNGPQRDLVHRMLLWKNDRAVVPLLEKMTAHSSRATARLQALCVLDGLNQLRPEILAPRLADESAGVRRHAVRLTEGRVAASPALADALMTLANAPSPAPAAVKPQNLPANAPTEANVQLQLAYSLGEWNDPRAGRALGAVLIRNAEDPYITAAAMSSVSAKNIDMVLATALAGVDGRAASSHLTGRLFVLAATLGSEDVLIDVLKQVAAPAADAASSDHPYATWQFAALAGCLDEFARRQMSLDKILAADGKTASSVARMFDHARRLVDAHDPQAGTNSTTSTKDADLAAAARLLGFDAQARTADVARLAKLVVPQSSAELQQTAIASLARIDDPAVAGALLASWPQLTPALRRSVADTLISRDRWALRLVEEVAAGRIAAAEFDAARRQRLLAHRDAAVRDRAVKLFAAAGDRARVVAQFHDLSKTPGDASRGATVFTRKCAACHRLNGAGHAVGADLAALTNRSADALLVAILDPNRAVEDKFIGYAVRTVDGRQLTGILASETGNSITLAGQDGKTEALLRTDIDELKTTGKSFMPEGLEKDLSRQDLADVIAYLQTLGPPPKSFEGNRPATLQPAADGTFTLAARYAAIFGPTLVFEQRHGNLGYWMKGADYARWTLNVPRAARFRVRIEYACDNASAGNELALESGAARLTMRVEGTTDWDSYRTIDLGTLDLAAGEQTLLARPAKEPQSAILDLKRIVLEPFGR